MALVDNIQALRATGLRVAAQVLPFAPVLARRVFGQAFAQTGYGKLANFEATTSFFQDLGIPAPAANAAFVGTVELLGGICLLLGLGTRLAAFLLLGTMMVAILTAHRGEFVDALLWQGDKNLSGVLPVPFFVALVWLIGQGPGRLAVDNVLGGNRRTVAVTSTIPAI